MGVKSKQRIKKQEETRQHQSCSRWSSLLQLRQRRNQGRSGASLNVLRMYMDLFVESRTIPSPMNASQSVMVRRLTVLANAPAQIGDPIGARIGVQIGGLGDEGVPHVNNHSDRTNIIDRR